MKKNTLGIDATNLRHGGGQTHLIEIINSIDPNLYGFNRVIIWGNNQLLTQIRDFCWLTKISTNFHSGGILKRVYWQLMHLSSQANSLGCNILFIPGGIFFGKFYPVVTINQNLLPFVWKEIFRYGFSIKFLKLFLIRFLQIYTFKKANGIIFLTNAAMSIVKNTTGEIKCKTKIIHHGFNNRFIKIPKEQFSIDKYSAANPYKIIYVSTIDEYKHQNHVVEAISFLRNKTKWPITLDLFGTSGNPKIQKKLLKAILLHDPKWTWVRLNGSLAYQEIHKVYEKADLGVWASSCEAFGIILLEKMASGLPIVSTQNDIFKEILGDSALYFDPEITITISNAIQMYIENPPLRSLKSEESFLKSGSFTWEKCAHETFKFLSECINE